MLDKQPPVIEECESPPIFLSTDKAGANISWDEPNIFDNSQTVEVNVYAINSIHPSNIFIRCR